MIRTRESFALDGAAQAPRRGRVLVVDDEPGVLRVLNLILGRHHDLVTEGRADAALRRILGGEHFDIIFSDLMMPGMSGIELLQELSLVAPDQARRLVFLTGGAVTPEAQAFLSTTTHHLIVKPFDVDDMLAFVSSQLSEDGPVP